MNCAARETLTLCVLGSGFSPTLFWLISSHSLLQVSSGMKCMWVYLCVCVYLRPVMPCGKLKWVFARSLSLATQRHFSRVTDLTLVHPFGTLVQSLLCPYLHFVLSNRQKHLPTVEGNRVLQLLFPRTKACRSSV